MCEKHLTDKIHRELCEPQMKLQKFWAEKKNNFRNAAPHIKWPPAGVIHIVIPLRMLCQNTSKIIMACVIYCCVPFQVSDKPVMNSELTPLFTMSELHMLINMFCIPFPFHLQMKKNFFRYKYNSYYNFTLFLKVKKP
jgi:hypothetical protein